MPQKFENTVIRKLRADELRLVFRRAALSAASD